MKNIIYLDNGATTKPDAKAIEYANTYITDNYFNPSATYHEGVLVAGDLKTAKETFKKVIILTSYLLLVVQNLTTLPYFPIQNAEIS